MSDESKLPSPLKTPPMPKVATKVGTLGFVVIDLKGNCNTNWRIQDDPALEGLSRFLEDLNAATPKTVLGQILDKIERGAEELVKQNDSNLLVGGASLELRLSKEGNEFVLNASLKYTQP